MRCFAYAQHDRAVTPTQHDMERIPPPCSAWHGMEQTRIPLVILNEVKNLFFYEVSFAHRNFTESPELPCNFGISFEKCLLKQVWQLCSTNIPNLRFFRPFSSLALLKPAVTVRVPPLYVR